MKKCYRFLLILPLLFPAYIFSATVNKTLYLNQGSFMAVDSTTFPAYAFNEDPVYSPKNATITLNAGDRLIVTVINTDSLQHGFIVKGFPGSSRTLIVMGVIVDTIDFPNPGVFIFHDNENYPRFTYLGAAGIISVESSVPDARFFWNLHEFNRLWNLNPDSAQTMNWLNFNPDYFTVNGASYPFIDADSSAKIRGAVGDTIYIYCANTGRSVHSIHFHGYHCRILHSSKNNQQVNWVKDSQAVWPMETVLFELVPDKPGLFPVHDHNLMALTANLYYSNGIMIMMHIQ